MKKTMIKIAGCALAFSLAAVPTVDAAKPVTKGKVTAVSKAPQKETAKQKAAAQQLTAVNRNIDKVEKNAASLMNKIDEFYAASATQETEKGFFKSFSAKLNANSKQLDSYKKQIDQVARKYGKTAAVTDSYTKAANVQTIIQEEVNRLKELHQNFIPEQAAELPAES
ncbi:hypothetical protein [Pseudobacillus wudalianchiensis]|uniref:Uncharacterized protein n=1 Tax=Pseudobacillus wudalianchiensis TaxID=1743143 RepID=A0A1B9B9S2_9BACI|nr:hypothetical protein [Bacillus wudalianchiensis]OCA92840.1 hypothetical protein A8F95_03905 [Bacillus wudalianchiensis]